MREERIVIAGRELLIARPDDPEGLIDEQRFEEDEFLPYWAELWPSGLALARYLAELDLTGISVLELGCGLALPSIAAAWAGAEVLATDWAPEAVVLAARNASANGTDIRTAVLAWEDSVGLEYGRFQLVVAADVLYERRNARPLLDLLEAIVAPDGEALIADPGRRHAPSFFNRVRATGWSTEHIAVDLLPAGSIVRIRRETATD